MPNATVPAAVGGLPAIDALDKIDAARDLIEAIFMASGDIRAHQGVDERGRSWPRRLRRPGRISPPLGAMERASYAREFSQRRSGELLCAMVC